MTEGQDMMNENVIQLRTDRETVTTDEYFGGCPNCGRTNGYITLNGGEHWFVCDEHQVRWCAGYGLFSDCAEPMSQTELAKHYRAISFRVVKPVYPTGSRGDNGGVQVGDLDDVLESL